MHITINRAELLDTASRAASIAPTASPIKEMTALLLEAESSGKIKVTATNIETSLVQELPCQITEEDAVAVNAKLFAAMMEKLGGDEVELFREPGKPQLRIRSGAAEYNVSIWERGGFPKPTIPFPEDTVRITGIPSMARRTVFAAAQEKDKNVSRPLLKCVNLMFTKDGLRAAGSDGTCVISAKGDEKSTGDISFLVPASSLDKLARMCSDKDEFRVGTTGKSLVFLRENFVYSVRLINEKYIDIEQLTGSLQKQFTVLTDVPDLLRGLESATTVDPGGKVALTFEGQRLHFRCESVHGTAASATDVIPLAGAPCGEYWYQSGQLYSCLRALSGTVQLSVAQGGMLLLETEDALYMQTGTKPSAAKVKKPAAKAVRKPPEKKAAA